jgi:hypothetical protein
MDLSPAKSQKCGSLLLYSSSIHLIQSHKLTFTKWMLESFSKILMQVGVQKFMVIVSIGEWKAVNKFYFF